MQGISSSLSANILIKSKISCCDYVVNNNCEYPANKQQSMIYKSQSLLNSKFIHFALTSASNIIREQSKGINSNIIGTEKTREKRLHIVKRHFNMLSFLHHGNYDSHFIEEF